MGAGWNKNKRITKKNLSIWELKISIYNDTFKDGGANKPIILETGKKLGFAIAYCDNDTS